MNMFSISDVNNLIPLTSTVQCTNEYNTAHCTVEQEIQTQKVHRLSAVLF
jgi:hypothetical protein